MTISPTTIYVRLYKKDPSSDTNWMQIRWRPTEPAVRERVLDQLSEEESFPMWEVQEAPAAK